MKITFQSGSESRTVAGGVRRLHRSRNKGGHLGRVAVIVALAIGGLGDAAHKVASGETLSRIAKKFGVTVGAIAGANGISDPNRIRVGQVLNIPGAPPAGPPAAVPAAAAPVSLADHTVAPGETLAAIAKAKGTTVAQLVEINGIKKRNLIRVGQVLKVPIPVTSVEGLLMLYASKYSVDASLVKALAWMESGWKQEVVSSKGAVGVMQVMPQTAAFISKHLLKEPVDINNQEQNIKAGVRFYAYLLTVTGGDERQALAGYFQGLRSVRTVGMSPRTQWYVDGVQALKQRFAGG